MTNEELDSALDDIAAPFDAQDNVRAARPSLGMGSTTNGMWRCAITVEAFAGSPEAAVSRLIEALGLAKVEEDTGAA